MAVQQATKKRIEVLEQASLDDDSEPTHIYLTAPDNSVKPVLIWVRPDHRSDPDDETSCLPDYQDHKSLQLNSAV